MKIISVWLYIAGALLLIAESYAQVTTSCLRANFTDVGCGDCKSARYFLKPTEQTGLSFVRCIDCNYFVPNDRELTSSKEFQDIGYYGCTWLHPAFFIKHPGIGIIVLGFLLAILGLIAYEIWRSIIHGRAMAKKRHHHRPHPAHPGSPVPPLNLRPLLVKSGSALVEGNDHKRNREIRERLIQPHLKATETLPPDYEFKK